MVRAMGLISANFSDSLGSITDQRSLASLPFGGRYRMVDFALSSMSNSGIHNVCLITPFMYRSIMDHVGAGKQWGLSRKSGGLFILPGAVYGMKNPGGSFLMRDLIQNRISLERTNADLVVMISSNKVFNYDFRDAMNEHIEQNRDITLFYKSTDKSEHCKGNFLVLDKDNNLTGITHKCIGKGNHFMDCIIINRKLLIDIINWYVAAAHVDFVDTISDNIGKLNIHAKRFTNYIKNIDTISDYMSANRDLLDESVNSELFRGEQKIYTKIQDSPPTRYRNSANVVNSIVPAGCEIEGTVENSVLFRGAKVCKGAVVKNSILLQRSVVEAGAVLENAICDKGVVISAGTKLFGTEGSPCIMAKSEIF